MKIILLYREFCYKELAETFNTHLPEGFPITATVWASSDKLTKNREGKKKKKKSTASSNDMYLVM
jgi:hypothetical protein